MTVAVEGLVRDRAGGQRESLLGRWFDSASNISGSLIVVFSAIVVTRVLLLLAGLGAIRFFPLWPGDGPWPGSPTEALLAVLSRWDGRWYISIAQDGYSYAPGVQSNVAFMPLYPALMHVLGALVGRSDTATLAAIGIIIANVSLVVALTYLFILVRGIWDTTTAVRTVVCLLAFPTSFFLSAVYPESLFLAAAIAAFVYARQGRWWLVGILCGLAALTRIYGVLLVAPLAYEYLRQHRWRPRFPILLLAIGPLAICLWFVYLNLVFGDPLLVLHAAATWDRRPDLPWQTLGAYFTNHLEQSQITDIVVVLGFCPLVIWTWRLGERGLALLTSALYLATISSGIYTSFPRYSIELFPAFITIARLTQRRWLLRGYLLVSGAASLYLFARFAVGHWVG